MERPMFAFVAVLLCGQGMACIFLFGDAPYVSEDQAAWAACTLLA